MSVISSRRSRRWCFTINNPTDIDDPQQWPYRYVVWQKEVGENRTPHFQGYVVWHRARTLSACKGNNPRAHWEIMRGSLKENDAYCRKEEGRIDGPWIRGQRPNPGKRNDLSDVCDMIMNNDSMVTVAKSYPTVYAKFYNGLRSLQTTVRDKERSRPNIFVFHGPSGVGKRAWCMKCFLKRTGNPRNKWWEWL